MQANIQHIVYLLCDVNHILRSQNDERLLIGGKSILAFALYLCYR